MTDNGRLQIITNYDTIRTKYRKCRGCIINFKIYRDTGLC